MTVPSGPWHRLLEIVRRRADPDATGPMADERLLARFVANGDPAAFELLVWRHGSLVYGTCRRVLGDAHAAEDAFQATFLALARKPRAVRSGAALAGWLHRVALRVANKLRASQARRNRAEQSAAQAHAVAPTDVEQTEVVAVVDEEIDRLPDRLRRAVVLCYLDGRTTEQAAQMLGCPRGTVLSRLSTARERLRGRLTRRGLALPVTGISTLMLASESPASLVSNTVRAVLTGASPLLTGLVQGVFHAMLITKVKIATAVVLGIGLAGAGVGWVIVPGSGPAVVQADEPKQPVKGSSAVATTTPQKTPEEPLDKTFELLFEAKKVLMEKLEQAEQDHQDFRLKNPYVFFPNSNPRSRLESISAKQTDLRVKRIELESRLTILRAAMKSASDSEGKERAARTVLLKLQMRGIDIAAMRKAVATDKSESTASEFLRTYGEALESELEELNSTSHALDDMFEKEQKMLREISNTELQDDRLRNRVIQNRQLLESITKRLSEVNLMREYIREGKPK
jgi:RNA polymerase sigma factor (sigma-70 family)